MSPNLGMQGCYVGTFDTIGFATLPSRENMLRDSSSVVFPCTFPVRMSLNVRRAQCFDGLALHSLPPLLHRVCATDHLTEALAREVSRLIHGQRSVAAKGQ
jgi:hypothetical protein